MTMTWTASELLTGKKFTDKGLLIAFKNGRQKYTSTTALQWDADLKFTLTETAATYLVEVNYGTSGAVAADIVTEWDVTGGATTVRTIQAMEVGGTTSSSTLIISREQSLAAWVSGTATTPAPCAVREKFLLTTGTQPSTLTLRWAQNVSDTAASSIHDYGWAVARRLA